MEIIGAESETVGELAADWSRHHRPGFEKLSRAVQRRVLQSQLVSLGLTADFELVESLRLASGVAISVSRDISVSRTTAGVVKLKPHQPVGFNSGKLAVNLAGRAGDVAFDAARVRWSFDTRKDFKRVRGHSACEFFDGDKVGSKIVLRHWQPGDRFHPIGFKEPAKLQDLLTNAKIPREQRHNLLVAATAAGEIFWVEGLRISESFKLTPATKRRLVWRWPRSQGFFPAPSWFPNPRQINPRQQKSPVKLSRHHKPAVKVLYTHAVSN